MSAPRRFAVALSSAKYCIKVRPALAFAAALAELSLKIPNNASRTMPLNELLAAIVGAELCADSLESIPGAFVASISRRACGIALCFPYAICALHHATAMALTARHAD
jgi:hypothetical protein